jgi:hypothetical protein
MVDDEPVSGGMNPFAHATDGPYRADAPPPHAPARYAPAPQPRAADPFTLLRPFTILLVIAAVLRIAVLVLQIIYADTFAVRPVDRDVGVEIELAASADIGARSEPMPTYYVNLDADRADRAVRIARTINVLTAGSLVLLVAVLLPWLVFAARNARLVCADRPRVSPAAAAWLFVIPVVNAFACGPVFRDLWRHSFERRQRRGNLAILAFTILTPIALGLALAGGMVAAATGKLTLLFVANGLSSAVPLLGAVIVTMIDRRQLATHELRLARGMGAP